MSNAVTVSQAFIEEHKQMLDLLIRLRGRMPENPDDFTWIGIDANIPLDLFKELVDFVNEHTMERV